MKISKFLVAAILLTAVGAFAQGGDDLNPGAKAETDGDTFNTNPTTVDDPKTFNANMDTNFTPPANNGGGKSGGKPNDGKTSGGNPGGGNKPAASAGIKLSGVTGEVKIKTAGGVMTVKAGEPVPEIPSGAEIIVVSGDANVAIGGTTVKAGAGDSFTVTTSGTGGASIAVTGGVVAIVDASGKSSDLAKGEGTTVSTAPAPVVKKTETKTVTKTETKPETPESIPADSDTSTSDTTSTTQSSPAQESATTTTTSTTCPPVTSVSAPCP